MRSGSASRTAWIVACARAAAGVDPIAERLVPKPLGFAVRRANGSRLVRALSLGLVAHLDIRTRAIDAVVLRERPTQLVVLGAGLDARAWRMPSLETCIVFEVDHPATQAEKRRRVAGAPLCAREVRFVGVDFEKDDLAERLAGSGHDAAARTTWIWEGVTPYLTRAAIDATLDIVAARSAPGSVLVATYGTPELGSVPRVLRPALGPAFHILGEPLHGLMAQPEAAARVEARGFVVEDDARISELAHRFGIRAPRIVIAEHVLVAISGQRSAER